MTPMNRRQFLKASVVGGAIITKLVLTEESAFAVGNGSAPVLVLIHARGGWDSANGLDPRLKGNENEQAILKNVFGENTAGQTLVKGEGVFRYRVDHPKIRAFLQTHGKNLAVMILKMDTNDHGAGTDNMATGTLSMNDPSIGALLAATYADDGLPTPFIVAGGSIRTGSLVPVANLGNVKDLPFILNPNLVDHNGKNTYYPASVESLIRSFRQSRLNDRLAKMKLPSHKKALQQLLLVANNKESLTQIASKLATEYAEGLDPTIEILLDLVELNMVRAISRAEGDFDTHGSGGQNQLPQIMGNYFDLVGRFRTRAVERGLGDKLVIVGGSEFSRTPNLNGGGGTDHWHGTNTVFLMGAQIKPQVIGQSDGAWYATPLHPTNLTPKSDGVIPTISDFHLALRQMLQIKPELSSRFPLVGSGIDSSALAKRFVGQQ